MDAYIPDAHRTVVWEAIGAAIRSKQAFELEHQVIRLDGTIGWTYSRAVPLLDQKGDIVEWFGTASDITERKQAEAMLKSRNVELERFNKVMVKRELWRTELTHENKALHGQRGDPSLDQPAVDPKAPDEEKGQVGSERESPPA